MFSKFFSYRCYSCLDAHFYDDETVTVVLKESVEQEGKERVLAQLPLSSVYTDEDQDREFIWDSTKRYWKTLSKSENAELKGRLSKCSNCVQLLMLCVHKYFKDENSFSARKSGVRRWKLPEQFVLCFSEGWVRIGFAFFETEYLLCTWNEMKWEDQLKTSCRIRNLFFREC